MKFKLYATSDWNRRGVINIKSLNGLIRLLKKSKDPLIIDEITEPVKGEPKYSIEIYDSYRE